MLKKYEALTIAMYLTMYVTVIAVLVKHCPFL